nr:PREDICTED: serine/threonine-protein phosphatase 5-like isoform X1 [Bemisia tabaci]
MAAMAERQTLLQLLIYQLFLLYIASDEGSVACSVKAPGRLYFSEVAPRSENWNAVGSANNEGHGLGSCPISCLPIHKATQDLSKDGISQKRLNGKISHSEGRVAEKTMARGGLSDWRLSEFGTTTMTPDLDALSNMMTIESDYTGLHLENEKVTVKFMEDLLTAFKDPKNLWKRWKPALHAKYVLIILRDIKKHYKKQPSLIEINVPRGRNITVVGDVHAHFSEIVKVFNVSGFPSETNYYLFNGDFVDRGDDDLQNALTIFGFKLLYPNSFFINRGNHEDRNQNSYAGFDKSCNRIYTQPITDAFHDVWTWLPLAHRINEKVLVVHGGLSPHKNVTLDDIRREPRGVDPKTWSDELYLLRERDDVFDLDFKNRVYKPDDKLPPPYQNESIMLSLLWADPMDKNGVAFNGQRGGCTRFGPDITENFCKRNKIEFVIRSHEPIDSPSFEGYYLKHGGRIITIFTVAGYCHQESKAAIIQMQAPDMKTHIIVWSTEERQEAFDSFVHEKVKLK